VFFCFNVLADEVDAYITHPFQRGYGFVDYTDETLEYRQALVEKALRGNKKSLKKVADLVGSKIPKSKMELVTLINSFQQKYIEEYRFEKRAEFEKKYQKEIDAEIQRLKDKEYKVPLRIRDSSQNENKA
jgi:hypothetical protein